MAKKKKKSRRSQANFEAQRMSVVLLILLLFVTCGTFAPVWFLMRRRFLDSLRSSAKMGQTLPVMSLLLHLVNLVVAFGVGATARGGHTDNPVGSFIGLVAGITSLVLAFKVRRMLQEHVARGTGGYTRLSWGGTFFFGCLYLQYKINGIADALRERPDIDASLFD